MKRANWMLAALLTIAAASCAERGGDDTLEPSSRGTGERNQRIGNDPAEQNTGQGSTRGESQSNQPPQADPPPQGNPPQ